MRVNLNVRSGRKKSVLVQIAKLDETMIVIALLVLAVSFLDFEWRPAEVVATFLYELSFGSSEYLNALIASRESSSRAMAISLTVIFSGLISSVIFAYLIPSSCINRESLNTSPALNLVKSAASLLAMMLILCAIYFVAMNISAGSDGKFKAILYPIIMNDAGLGVICSIIITAASFFIAVIVKTIYTVISKKTKEV